MKSRQSTSNRRLPHVSAVVAAWVFAGIPGIARTQ
jgi:hypothetical protein